MEQESNNNYTFNLLNHLPEYKTFIYVDEGREKLFKYKKILTEFSEILGENIKNLSRYRNGTRHIPLRLFFKLLKLSNKKLRFFQDKITIKVGKIGNRVRIGPFINITPDWIYISELIRGDGSLNKCKNNYYNLVFVNTDQGLIDYVRNFFLNLGIYRKSLSVYNASSYPHIKHLVVRSEIFPYIFHSIFKIPLGGKLQMNFPDFIFKDRNFAINAIRGIFDAEGSVHIKYNNNFCRRVVICSFDSTYLNNIKMLLIKFNIHSYIHEEKRGHMKFFYRLIIGERDSILRFKIIIKPKHRERKKKLKFLTDSYTSNWYSFRTEKLRILELLKKRPSRRKRISKSLKIQFDSLGWFLTKLRRENLITVKNRIVTCNGSWFVYRITDSGKDYLKLYSEDFS